MLEESPLIKNTQIKTEQDTCSCGCTGQENVNFEKSEQKQINQCQDEPTK